MEPRKTSMTLSRIRLVCLSVATIAALAIAACAFAHSASRSADDQYLSNIEASAKYSSSDFAVDGNLSKPAWKAASWVEFDHDPTGKTENPSIKTRVATIWSKRYIYFAFSG